MALKTSCIAGALPMISAGCCCDGAAGSDVALVCSMSARLTIDTASSTSNGFGMYSKAPPWIEATALSRSEWAVITMTGTSGCCSLSRDRSASPSIPPMRISLTTTSGWPESISVNRASADSKQVTLIPSFDSALSSTHRMDFSSSATQTRLAVLMTWLSPRE